MTGGWMRFSKGHGTGNDFVVLPDVDGARALTPTLVAAVCDRRFGIGADGVLRVVRSAAHPDGLAHAGAAEWFMDYWNADGSLAEMCGNGARVFARYLVESGLVGPDTTEVPIATRAGVVRATVGPRAVSVEMPLPRLYGEGSATAGGLTVPGVAVDCGNPHLVCVVPAGVDLATVDLSRPPRVDPALFPAGVNVEFVAPAVPLDNTDVHLRVRVHERGSGETLSCGTGAVAVAAAALAAAGSGAVGSAAGSGAVGSAAVDLPGGRLSVTLDSRACWLSGPAVLLAHGEVDTGALRR